MRKAAFIAFIVFFLDQITKYLVLTYLEKPFSVIGKFFQLSLYQNTGIAFSLNMPRVMVIVLTYILLFMGIYFAYRELNLKNKWAALFLGMVVGGAVGNLVDRMVHGSVVDFFAVAQYPVFNFADICITVGLFSIVLFYDKIKA